MKLFIINLFLALLLMQCCAPSGSQDMYTVEVHFENNTVKTIVMEGSPVMDYNGNLANGCNVVARNVQSFSIVSIKQAPKKKK
jgi:hypothetical protein